jgi:hypothetical protein
MPKKVDEMSLENDERQMNGKGHDFLGRQNGLY